MADLPYIQTAQEIKITGQDSTGDTVNYVTADTNGNLAVKDYADGTPASAAPTVATQVGGTDGTNLRTLSTDTSGHLNINIVAALPAGTNAIGKVEITDGTDTALVTTTGDQNVADVITTSLISGNLAVGTTAVACRVGSSNLASRKVLQVTPVNGPVYYGASGVTTATGTPIQTNQTITFAISAAVDVFIISASVSQNARIIEAS